MRKILIDKLYGAVQQDAATVDEFKKYLGGRELYKFISDAVENSRNILLVIDGSKEGCVAQFGGELVMKAA
ncbi:MAG: hypothetical protein ACLQU3_19235 [Limisphaerales bacterium]